MPVNTEGQLLADRYRVLARLGSGGMATVFLCEDTRLRRKVAVKRLHAESPRDTARRFQREARLGASLNHRNVVLVFDTVTDDEGVLIVMEYVEGETLAKLIQREGGIEPRRAVEILRGVAAALDHAHEQGVVHRDVKPANVLIGKRGEVKLVDLGIATALEGTRITRSGTVLGTAAYMAPEQIDGAKPDRATDVYSLATVAFELLSGRKAREGRTPVEIAQRVVAKPPPLLTEAWPDAPAEVVEVVERGMCRDPAQRPPSATAFVTELEAAMADTDPDLRVGQATGGAAELDAGDRFGEVPVDAAREGNGAGRTARSSPVATEHGTAGPTAARTHHALPAAPRRHESAAPRVYPAHRRRELSWLIPAAAAAVLVLLVAGILLLSSGGGDGGGQSDQPAAERSQPSDRDSGSSEGGGEADPAQPAAPAPGGSGETGSGGSGYEVPQPGGDDPARGAQLNDEGYALVNRGQPAEAVPILEEAVRSFPPGTRDVNYAFALYNLGHALRLAGRPADAIPVLEQRLGIDNQRDVVRAELDRARRDAGQ
jgi:serine/threonine-protein kinase